MSFSRFLILCAFLFVGHALPAFAQLRTVPYVEVDRYLGTWYQIARNPLIFEGNCVCSRQVLSVSNGRVDVYNSCNEPSTGELREIRGFATNNDPSTNAQFTVDFGLPHTGQYWIIGLDTEYRYAVVSDPSKLSLYVLSKTPTLDPELYDEAVQIAAEQVDVSRLVMTPQMGCVYP
jgi:apolipoprotein D and lipocalin family protein